LFFLAAKITPSKDYWLRTVFGMSPPTVAAEICVQKRAAEICLRGFWGRTLILYRITDKKQENLPLKQVRAPFQGPEAWSFG
jgi:hypothetical protein